ncbi:MAG: Ig-like domain-containing protein [Pseudomonadota bacterium]
MAKDLTSLSMKPSEGELKVGTPVQLNLFAHDNRGRADLVPGNMAVWTSGNTSVAEVSRQGRLTPRGPGSVTIVAVYADKKAVGLFTVVD